jgi:hypothetical protein
MVLDLGILAASRRPQYTPVQYLRIVRSDGRAEFMNIAGLELWRTDIERAPAVTGSMSPNSNHPAYDWPALDDGLPQTFAQTDALSTGFMELDFGRAWSCQFIRVTNRADVPDRIVGTTLYALDKNRAVVFSYTWTTIPPTLTNLPLPLAPPLPLVSLNLTRLPYTVVGSASATLAVETLGNVSLDDTLIAPAIGDAGSAAFRRIGFLKVHNTGSGMILSGAFRIELWVRLDSRYQAHSAIIDFTGFVMYQYNGNDVFIINNTWHTRGNFWPRDRWVQVIVTRTAAGRLTATVDGLTHVDLPSHTATIGGANAVIFIGAALGGGGSEGNNQQVYANIASVVIRSG